ncbi:hypothetical protein ACEPPN_004925 [Leptodophora sp. 'Broadleaf-Isolate-01']
MCHSRVDIRQQYRSNPECYHNWIGCPQRPSGLIGNAVDVGEDVVLEELVVVMEEIGFDVVDGEDVVLEELVVVVEEIGFDVVAEEVLEEETAVVERESELDKVDFEITLDVVEEIDVIERVREMDVVDRETILEVVTPTLLLD